jgi:hypothetical protein
MSLVAGSREGSLADSNAVPGVSLQLSHYQDRRKGSTRDPSKPVTKTHPQTAGHQTATHNIYIAH